MARATLRAGIIAGLGVASLTGACASLPGVRAANGTQAEDQPLPQVLVGEATCTARTVQVCLEGACGPSDDAVTVNVRFDGPTIETCIEGADVCDRERVRGSGLEMSPSGAPIVRLYTNRTLFSSGYEEGRVVGDFVMTGHTLRTVFMVAGVCE